MSDEGDDIEGHIDDGAEQETRTQRAARMKRLAAIAQTLVGLKPTELAILPLPAEISEAVVACRGFTKNAHARQLRRIAGLLRTIDMEPVVAALREQQTGRGERSRREKEHERWRARLLEEGPEAMTAFVAQHPGVDVQGLRQRVRAALAKPESVRAKGAARELLRMIRAASEPGGAAQPEAATDANDNDDDGAHPSEPT